MSYTSEYQKHERPNLDDREVADHLYTTYCVAVGGKAFNGDPLPDWKTFSEDLKKEVQVKAWREVAIRAAAIWGWVKVIDEPVTPAT